MYFMLFIELMNEWMYKRYEKTKNWFCIQMPLLVAERALLMIISFIILFSRE